LSQPVDDVHKVLGSVWEMDLLDTIQLKARRIRRRLRHVKRTVSDQYLLAQRPIEYVVFGVILAVAVALVAYLAMWPHA